MVGNSKNNVHSTCPRSHYPAALVYTIQVFLQHRVSILSNFVSIIRIDWIKTILTFPNVGHTIMVGIYGGGCAFKFWPSTYIFLSVYNTTYF